MIEPALQSKQSHEMLVNKIKINKNYSNWFQNS